MLGTVCLIRSLLSAVRLVDAAVHLAVHLAVTKNAENAPNIAYKLVRLKKKSLSERTQTIFVWQLSSTSAHLI